MPQTTIEVDEAIDDTARLLIEAADRHGTDVGNLVRSIPDDVLESIFCRVLDNAAETAAGNG